MPVNNSQIDDITKTIKLPNMVFHSLLVLLTTLVKLQDFFHIEIYLGYIDKISDSRGYTYLYDNRKTFNSMNAALSNAIWSSMQSPLNPAKNKG